MESQLKNYLSSLDLILEKINFCINSNSSYSSDIQRIFFNLRMRFESLSEDIIYDYNHYDYQAGVKITKKLGQVSIARISRKLNLRYNQVFEMVLKMEKQGLIHKPDETGVRFFVI